MKMAYEHLMMQAELFVANQYIAGCDNDPNLSTDISLSNATAWYMIDNGWGSDATGSGVYVGAADLFGGIVFDDEGERREHGQGNNRQYYWTTTSQDVTYYLEYSNQYTAKNGEMYKEVFVLYKEDGKPGSSNANALDAANPPNTNAGQANSLDTALSIVHFNVEKPQVISS